MYLPCNVEAHLLKLFTTSLARRIVQGHTKLPSVFEESKSLRIFVDVSVFSKHDAGTGIQRVVREVLNHLGDLVLDDYQIVPIAAKPNQRYKVADLKSPSNWEEVMPSGADINPKSGDIFLGLDLAAHILPKHWSQILQWKRNGANIQIVVYDILPVLRPEWFTKKSTNNFSAWLKTIAVFADKFHCISQTVKTELTNWLQERYKIALASNQVYVFPLGSNLGAPKANNNTDGSIPKSEHFAVNFMLKNPTALMVGTVEPRKGHAHVIDAFLKIWAQGINYQLVIVGTSGWKTEDLQNKISSIAADQTTLLWLKDVDDNLLENLYSASTGVIIASEGEGYGLPLVEADFYGKPVLVRDIPVFREVAKRCVTFFPNNHSNGLTPDVLIDWFETSKLKPNTPNITTTQISWSAATSALFANIKFSS